MKKLFSIWMAAVFAIFLSSGLSQPVQAANSASIAGHGNNCLGALNVRSSASTSGKIVASLPRGSNVTLLSKSRLLVADRICRRVNMAMYMAII